MDYPAHTEEKPVINCHTHIFTADHVPPFLAKTYIPWPFYYLVHLGVIVFFFRSWYNHIEPILYKPFYKTWIKLKTMITWLLNWARPVKIILAYYITIQVFFILYDFINAIVPAKFPVIEKVRTWLSNHYLLLTINSIFLRVLLVLVVLLFIPSGRSLLLFILKKIWQFFSLLPGKQTKEMFRRYLNIGRYAFHRDQHTIFGKMRDQYREKTGFIILPMDMEFMNAGRVRCSYRKQMEILSDMKKNPLYEKIIYPFVFADPRRFKKEKDYFVYHVKDNKVVPDECFIKRFIVDEKFSGIKIYPALGYYPFDEELLALWKYAADNGLPVLTHCIRGTIFYRGRKNWEWNKHPVFNQAMGNGRWPDLVLPEMNNADFSVNFTHPLNYLCLLDENLLRIVVSQAKDEGIKKLFGFSDLETPLIHNLENLKLCFGHYGGDDEWMRYFEKDRFGHSAQLAKHPCRGIEFLTTNAVPSKGKPEQLWKDTDWYSIISSMILQYPNVYADISYILHNSEEIFPLLKQTLQHEKLRTRVLYGTDFYVVRNHKSDRNLLADMSGGLDKDEFESIAKTNPRTFLYNAIHGELTI